MSADIASLGIKVTQSGIEQADQALAKLERTSGVVQRTVLGLEKQAGSLNTQFTRTGHNTNIFSRGMKTAANDGKAFGRDMHQVTYQVDDFLAHVQSGGDPMKAFGMQMADVAAVFGPLGGVIGVAIGAISLLAPAFMEASNGTTVLKEDLDSLVGSFNALSAAEQTKYTMDIQTNLGEVAGEMNILNARSVSLNNELRNTERDLKATKEMASGVFVNWRIAELEGEIESLNSQIINTDSSLSALGKTYGVWSAQLGMIKDGTIATHEATQIANEATKELTTSYELQAKMVGKTAVEQAKLTAIEQLGAGATKEQIQQITTKIDAYYRLSDAENLRLANLAATEKANDAATKSMERSIAADIRKAELEEAANERKLKSFDMKLDRVSVDEDPMGQLILQRENMLKELEDLDVSDAEREQRRLQTIAAYGEQEASLRMRINETLQNDAQQKSNNRNQLLQTDLQMLGNVLGEENAVYKAAAIAFMVISGARAAQKVFDDHVEMFPGPFGVVAGGIAAGLVVANTAMNVAAVTSARIQGGDTPANTDVLVGERGPEVVRFNQPSNITPTSGLGGGGDNITQQISITVQGSGDAALIDAMQKAAKEGARQGYQLVYKDFKGSGSIKKISKK